MSENVENMGTTGMALDVWDIVAVVCYFGLILGVGLMVSFLNGIFHLVVRVYKSYLEWNHFIIFKKINLINNLFASYSNLQVYKLSVFKLTLHAFCFNF